jgi:ornithine cyclodeaminase/alanine dehydrogenase-like protein (mu-crystallin family)
MITIDEATVRSAITWDDVIASAAAAFRALGAGRVDAPGEIAISPSAGAVMHAKGAHVHGSGWIVVKMATGGFSGSNDGCSIVCDATSGAIVALVDDKGWLTELRTAGAGAFVTDLLARSDATSLALIGSGVQAQLQLAALRHLRPGLQVRVASRSFANSRRFADAHDAVAVDRIDAAVDGADVVVCATSSNVPLVARVTAGVHVTSIGTDTIGKAELAASLLESADFVVVDDVELSRRVGVLQQSPHLAARTVSAVLADPRLGRHSNQQITVAGLSGLGVQDATIAGALFERLGLKT